MTKEELILSAKKQKQVSEKAFNEFDNKKDSLTNLMNSKMAERSDIKELVGEKNLDMMSDNHANHIRFMGSIFHHYNAETFVETILWVFKAYRSRGFHTNYWAALMNTFIEVYKNNLSEETFKEIFPYYNWMQVNIPVFVKLTD